MVICGDAFVSCMCTCMCMCVWWSIFVYVCMCMEARDQFLISFLRVIYLIFLETKSFIDLGLTVKVSLADQQALRFICLYLLRAGMCKHTPACQSSGWVLGMEFRPFCFCSKYFTCAHYPSLFLSGKMLLIQCLVLHWTLGRQPMEPVFGFVVSLLVLT